MKNIEIIAIMRSYMKEREEKRSLVLPVAVAWKRRLNMKKISEAANIIEEALSEVDAAYSDDEHSKKMENGRQVKEEHLKEYYNKRGEILDQETDLEIKMVGIEELDGVTLDDDALDTLAFMIKEE